MKVWLSRNWLIIAIWRFLSRKQWSKTIWREESLLYRVSTNWHQSLQFYNLPQDIDTKQLPGVLCDIKLSCISTINNIDKMWYVVVNIWRSHGIHQNSYQFHFDLFSNNIWMSINSAIQFTLKLRRATKGLIVYFDRSNRGDGALCNHSVCINNHLECCNFLWHRCEFHLVFMGNQCSKQRLRLGVNKPRREEDIYAVLCWSLLKTLILLKLFSTVKEIYGKRFS